MSGFERYALDQPEALWLLALLPLLLALRERATAGHPAWRSFGAMIGRLVAAVLLVLAMAKPVEEAQRPDRWIGFVVDASHSLDSEAQRQAEDWLRDAWASRGETPATLVVAGKPPRIVASLEQGLSAVQQPAPAGAGTDLRFAMELALAHVPDARQRDLVLLSDGASTRGKLDDVLRVAAARDVAVHTVPLGPGWAGDGQLLALRSPTDPLVGDKVEFTVTVRPGQSPPDTSPEDRRAVVLRDVESEVELARALLPAEPSILASDEGATEGQHAASDVQVALNWTPKSSGTHHLAVVLEDPADPRHANNTRRARVRVQARPRVLVVGGEAGAGALRKALEKVQPSPSIDRRDQLPTTGFEAWNLVVLLDPDLQVMSYQTSAALARWTRSGGRLLVTGGAAGLVTEGEAIQPLAELLPVRFPNTKKPQRAPLTVLYCLDSSDSMAGGAKFELAAAALVQSLHLLPEGSRVGVLHFADFPAWAYEVNDFSTAEPIIKQLGEVPVGGGTSIFGALQTAYTALVPETSLLKHVVLLSDGQSTSTFARSGDIVTAMRRRQMTVSSIAVSAEANRTEMERIAEAGGGRAYYAERFTDLPRLFLDEMMMVTRTNKVEETFTVLPVVGSSLLAELPPDTSYPPLRGYVRGELKAGSSLALATAEGQPILLTRPHGRGQVTLFTSDLGGPWSIDWRDWKHHGALWEGVLASIMRSQPVEHLDLQTRVTEDSVHVLFDALDPLLNPRGDLVVEAAMDLPDGSTVLANLPPVGPGRYGAELPLPGDGATLLRVASVGTTGEDSLAAPGGELSHSVERALPAELRAGPYHPGLLQAAAEATNGLFDPQPSQLFSESVPTRTVREERWMPPLLAALVLLMLDLAWRRLRLPRRNRAVA